MGNAVTVELSADEALVLFEWLAGLGEAKFAVGATRGYRKERPPRCRHPPEVLLVAHAFHRRP